MHSFLRHEGPHDSFRNQFEVISWLELNALTSSHRVRPPYKTHKGGPIGGQGNRRGTKGQLGEKLHFYLYLQSNFLCKENICHVFSPYTFSNEITDFLGPMRLFFKRLKQFKFYCNFIAIQLVRCKQMSCLQCSAFVACYDFLVKYKRELYMYYRTRVYYICTTIQELVISLSYTGCFLIKATGFWPLFKPCKNMYSLQIWYNFEAYKLVFAFQVLKGKN